MHVQLTTAGQAESLGFSAALHVQYAIANQGLCGASREAAPLGRMQDTNTRYGPSHGNASRYRGGVFDFGKFGHGTFGRCCVLIAAADAACWCVNTRTTRYWLGVHTGTVFPGKKQSRARDAALAMPDEYAYVVARPAVEGHGTALASFAEARV
jgi:hypothetical protein